MWNRYGRSGLEKQRNTQTTPEFKEKIIHLILEKGVPLSYITNRLSYGQDHTSALGRHGPQARL